MTTEAIHRHRGSRRRALWIIAGLWLALVVLILVSLMIGRYVISAGDVVRILFRTKPLWFGADYADAPWTIVQMVRLPRVLLVALSGMGLALGGAALQGVFRNPLIGPEIAGVSSGAALGGVIAILFAWPTAAVVATAFGGGIAALMATFGLALLAGRGSMLALVLSGVVVGTLFSSLTGLVQTIADSSRLPSMLYWLLGGFSGATYSKLAVVASVLLVAGGILLMLRWRINLLSLGEVDAATLGINLTVLRWTVIICVAAIVAAQVAVSGSVGWVGLIIPHIARMLVGPEHGKLMPASAFLGALYLVAMDDLARTMWRQELPIGLLTSVAGAPIFAYLLWRTNGQGWQRE